MLRIDHDLHSEQPFKVDYSYKEFRQTKGSWRSADFLDVTLACKDEDQIKTCRVVCSSFSPVSKEFSRTNLIASKLLHEDTYFLDATTLCEDVNQVKAHKAIRFPKYSEE